MRPGFPLWTQDSNVKPNTSQKHFSVIFEYEKKANAKKQQTEYEHSHNLSNHFPNKKPQKLFYENA